MRRYAESSRHFWSKTINHVRSQHSAVIEPIEKLQQNELKNYRVCRRNFEAAQVRFDNLLSKYMGLVKNKEASALREDAFQLAESRTAYIKACFELCTTISLTQSKLDICLVKTLSDPWILQPKELATADPISQRIGFEMLRLRSWVKAMQKLYKPHTKEMEKAAKDMEQATIEKWAPSRDLNSYMAANSTILHFVPKPLDKSQNVGQNYGWLYVKSSSNKGVRQVWVRRWIFVENGMFGWLNVSPFRTCVQESDKIGVLLCHVTPFSAEDRRFCFEIKTKDTVLFLQAETLEEMRTWLQVFEDAKRLAVESDKRSTISYAFQRFPPMISEFASTAGTSVDVELTNDKPIENQGPHDSPALGKCIALSKNSDAINLQASMSVNDSPDKIGVLSALGPFAAALAPSPLLNTPMPTSMTQEAISSSSLCVLFAFPTAITANYWGSANWALSANKGSVLEEEKGFAKGASAINVSLGQHPAFYPPVLRSQDAQLRAIFQTIGDTPNDRVVLVFRCLFRPSPSQQIPCRIYFTPNALYLYSHSLGTISTLVLPMKSLVSVEGRTGLQQDTLFLITSAGSATCDIFLDSRHVLQKRIQFLIDNYHAEESLELQAIIEKLQSFGCDQKDEEWMEDDEHLDQAREKSDNILDCSLLEPTLDGDSRTEVEKRLFSLYMNNYMHANTAVTSPIFTKKKKEIARVHQKSESIDMSKLMSQLSIEHDFDIPPKALFHIMFGETSPVFRYDDTGSIIRTDMEFSPWKALNSKRMEREIFFKIKESKTPVEGILDKIMYVQRLEKMDDNTEYVIYERHTVVKLSQGDSFYTTHRYVITRTSRGTSKLSIWSSVEWINASILKSVTEPFLLKRLKAEVKIVVNRSLMCRRQLGVRGSTATAIRMFGKIGSSKSVKVEPFEVTEMPVENLPETRGSTISISRTTLQRSLLEAGASAVFSMVGEVCLLLQDLAKVIWSGIRSNKIIIFGLLLSCFFNIFLMGRSTSSYWMELHAQQYADKLSVSPRSQSIMSRAILLKDVDMLIQNGSQFSLEATMPHDLGQDIGESLCYAKFKTLALLPGHSEGSYSFNDTTDVDQALLNTISGLSSHSSSSTVRSRIFGMRSKLGIKRNRLMVELRSINRIESELVIAEWKSWLYDEVSLCLRLTQEFTAMQQENSGQETKGKIKDSGLEMNDRAIIKVIREAPLGTRQALNKYCLSCSRELNSLRIQDT